MKTVYLMMRLEKKYAPKAYFGPLPWEQIFTKRIEERVKQYNEGLISSLELFQFMTLEAHAEIKGDESNA